MGIERQRAGSRSPQSVKSCFFARSQSAAAQRGLVIRLPLLKCLIIASIFFGIHTDRAAVARGTYFNDIRYCDFALRILHD